MKNENEYLYKLIKARLAMKFSGFNIEYSDTIPISGAKLYTITTKEHEFRIYVMKEEVNVYNVMRGTDFNRDNKERREITDSLMKCSRHLFYCPSSC